MWRTAKAAVLIAVIAFGPATATSVRQVDVSDLFAEADVVALLYIKAGTGEDYENAMYKAKILSPYKGVAQGDIIYFGPYVSYGIGNEYVAFLKRTDQVVGDFKKDDVIEPIFQDESSEPYYSIMYQGYSIMPVSYTCALPKCDYAIKVAFEQVVFPKKVAMSKIECTEGASNNAWVHKETVLELLSKLARSKKSWPRLSDRGHR